MSERRINDGYLDCLSGEDERNENYSMIEPYRYRCLDTTITQYVSYQQLGNEINECLDGSDELSNQLNWFYFRCEFGDEYPCWIFRGTGLENDNRIKDVRLPFHRHCDSIWDTRDGQDEKNCSQWVCPPDSYQCQNSGQCISQLHLCDGEFDCGNGEDELNCSVTKVHWTLEDRCNNSREHFCITSNYLFNRTLFQPCIDFSKTGDGHIDCIGGRDERNVFSCSDHRMLGDRFLCDKETKCLSHTVLCDGIVDCFDQTDELICYWGRYQCLLGQFACSDSKYCPNTRCSSKSTCPKNEHLFWCPNSQNSLENSYRSTKLRRRSSYNLLCNSYELSNTISRSVTIKSSKINAYPQFQGYCNRGFYLLNEAEQKPSCFCPPNFYGDRCQFNRRRITIRIRFDRRYRSDIPSVLHVLALLLYNGNVIIDHRRFVDIDEDFPQKHKGYLLYSHPNLTGNYSVRFETYQNLQLISVWEYPIYTIGFLPVFQLAKILRFPDRSLPWRCFHNHCKNNGSCYVIVNQDEDHYMCLCQKGWIGNLCEKPLEHSNCASHSLSRSENVCVCPDEYLPPHCFVRNTICENKLNTCSSDKTCLPLSVLPPHQYLCLRHGSIASNLPESILLLNRQTSYKEAFLLQLLKISSDYPRLRQQILVGKSTEFPTAFLINTKDPVYNMSIPEMGILYTFEPQIDSVIIHLSILYINCSNTLRNLSIDLDTQPSRCKQIVGHPSVKLLNNYCHQFGNHQCFYTDNYICYCRPKTNRSECLSYDQRKMDCSYCINKGYCIQGNLQNRSDFGCVCPKCVLGDLCQFSTNRFSVELEMLIEQTGSNRLHLLGPTLFFLIGLIFNGLGINTFAKQKARQAGSGIYLLVNGFISQLVIILLFTRINYLIYVQQMEINLIANQILCKSLPYLMAGFRNTSTWLMTFVTVERALAATWPVKYRSLRTPRCAVILTTITLLILFSSLCTYINEYKVIIRPDHSYTNCVREIPSNRKLIIQYTSLAHHITPFLVNFFAGIIVIIEIGRSKATSHHTSPRSTIAEEARERVDLLVGPFIYFISALPQLIILFFDACIYERSTWFIYLTLITYYFSFIPQIILFFLYVIPSPTYKLILINETKIGPHIARLLCLQQAKSVNDVSHSCQETIK